MQFPNRRGFTLLELLVVVLIIGVLVAVAIVMYNRVFERMRIAEADTVISAAVGAQERLFLKRSKYTNDWTQLDAVPETIRGSRENNPFLSNDHTIYYTNGIAQSTGGDQEAIRPGYAIYFQKKTDQTWYVVAERIGWAGYDYSLVKEFDFQTGPKRTVCLPGSHKDDKRVCMDYMGIDNEADIPDDPRN